VLDQEALADSSEEELVQVRVDDSLLRAVGIGVGLAALRVEPRRQRRANMLRHLEELWLRRAEQRVK